MHVKWLPISLKMLKFFNKTNSFYVSLLLIALAMSSAVSAQSHGLYESDETFNVYGKNSKRFLQKLPIDTEFFIVKSQANWQLVQFKNREMKAWVSDRYVVINANQVVVSGGALNARQQPHMQASIITQLQKGYQSELLGQEAGFVQLYLPAPTIFAVKSADISIMTERNSRWQLSQTEGSGDESITTHDAEVEQNTNDTKEINIVGSQELLAPAKVTSSNVASDDIATEYQPPAARESLSKVTNLKNQQTEQSHSPASNASVSNVPINNTSVIVAANVNVTADADIENANDRVVIGDFYNKTTTIDQPATPVIDSKKVEANKPHRISPGDTISLQVFGEPDMSLSSARVPEAGDVSFPLIGTVKVAGSTIKELEQHIRGLLVQGYIRNPKLSVTIEEYRPIFIKGAVSVTGSFPYSERLTVSKALALAGGLTESADRQGIIVSRDGNTLAKGLSVDSQYLIESGDVISVREEAYASDGASLYVYLHGEVEKPGAYEYRKGLTIEKAVVLAGGFSLRASKRRVSVTRAKDDQAEPERLKKVKLYMPVLPGDIIDVGASWF